MQRPNAQQELIMATKPTTAPSAITRTPSKTAALVDAVDGAYSKILKLHAMLHCTYGEAGDTFRNLHDDLQDSFLWACTDMAEAVKAELETSFSEAGHD
jgi:hypothetical protein